MVEILSDGAEYLPTLGRQMQQITGQDVLDYLMGKKGGATQKLVGKDTASLVKMIPGVSPRNAVKIGRFAGRVAPALSALTNVTDVADIIAGGDSFGNKAMDAGAMALGGTAGFFLGGPLGASIGASVGKALSDGTQAIFGGGESGEERKLREALALLQGGGI